MEQLASRQKGCAQETPNYCKEFDLKHPTIVKDFDLKHATNVRTLT